MAALLDEHDLTICSIDAGDQIPKDSDIYAFTCATTQVPWVKGEILRIKKTNPNSFIIVGGPHPTMTKQSLGADCCFIGEAEVSINDVVKEQQRGIVFGEKPEKLDNFPFPKRDADFLSKYYHYLAGKRTTSMVTSRGCPFNCAYCCGVNKPVRFRSPLSVYKEARQIKELGYDSIVFYDDIFTLRNQRLKKMCDLISQLDIQWKCLSRGDLVDKEMVDWMVKAGCIEVSFGVESGSQKMLENVNRHVKTADSIKAIRMCNDAGLRTRAFFIIGLPGESWESIEETRRFLLKAQPTTFNLSMFMPYPGSDIFEHKERYDIEFDKSLILEHPEELWYQRKFDEYTCLVRTSAMTSEEILKTRKQLSEEFEEEERYWERKDDK